MSLTAFFDSHLSFAKAGSPDVGRSEHSASVHRRINFSNGTGANQATNVFVDTRTLAASTSEDLDLAGVLVNALGETLTFTAIKLIRVHASPDNGGNIVMGRAASNAFVGPFADATDKIAIAPGGCFDIVNPSAAGWAVAAGTGDKLKIANSDAGAAGSYTIEILGEA